MSFLAKKTVATVTETPVMATTSPSPVDIGEVEMPVAVDSAAAAGDWYSAIWSAIVQHLNVSFYLVNLSQLII